MLLWGRNSVLKISDRRPVVQYFVCWEFSGRYCRNIENRQGCSTKTVRIIYYSEWPISFSLMLSSLHMVRSSGDVEVKSLSSKVSIQPRWRDRKRGAEIELNTDRSIFDHSELSFLSLKTLVSPY
jgi:hypothetical protein